MGNLLIEKFPVFFHDALQVIAVKTKLLGAFKVGIYQTDKFFSLLNDDTFDDEF